MSRLAAVSGRGPTLGLLLLGAGLGLVTSAQPWWRASSDGASVTFSGSDVSGGLGQALAAVTLAGALLVLVLQRRGRRVLAVALAATGLGMITTGSLQTAPDTEVVRSRVRQVSLTDQFALDSTVWPWVYAVAGLIVVAAAVLLWLGASRWTTRVSRFDRSPSSDLSDDPARVWKDLDAGLDPTDVGDEPTPDPDVRPGEERVTMEPTHDHRRE